MGLRNEQCEKVCRIIDDVLANRSTERDSLIVAVQKAFKSLERLESASPNSSESPNNWISCSERLPELYKPVLVTGGDIIWICELIESPDLDDGEFQWEDKMLGHWYSFDNWDAWMPLPAPYQPNEDES